MKIQFTTQQLEALKNDGWFLVDCGDGREFYFEFNTDCAFTYGELQNSKSTVEAGYARTYWFDTDGLNRLYPTKPRDPSYYHNDPLCPTCGTYMIYKFECCPRCGQALDWRERQ